MALWQFTFRIVPRKVLINTKGGVPTIVPYDEFLDLPMWDIQKFEEELFRMLDSSFEKTRTEEKKMMVWGKSCETDLSIFYDENQLVDFTVRLDLRSLKKETFELIVQVGTILNAVLVTELGSVIEPSLKNLINEIKKSKAFKFINNPWGFFDNLSGE